MGGIGRNRKTVEGGKRKKNRMKVGTNARSYKKRAAGGSIRISFCLVNSVPRTNQHLHRSERLFLNSLVILAVSKVRVCPPLLWENQYLIVRHLSQFCSSPGAEQIFYRRASKKITIRGKYAIKKMLRYAFIALHTARMEFDIHLGKGFFRRRRGMDRDAKHTDVRFSFHLVFCQSHATIDWGSNLINSRIQQAFSPLVGIAPRYRHPQSADVLMHYA